jgi:hypothetical protein
LVLIACVLLQLLVLLLTAVFQQLAAMGECSTVCVPVTPIVRPLHSRLSSQICLDAIQAKYDAGLDVCSLGQVTMTVNSHRDDDFDFVQVAEQQRAAAAA